MWILHQSYALRSTSNLCIIQLVKAVNSSNLAYKYWSQQTAVGTKFESRESNKV